MLLHANRRKRHAVGLHIGLLPGQALVGQTTSRHDAGTWSPWSKSRTATRVIMTPRLMACCRTASHLRVAACCRQGSSSADKDATRFENAHCQEVHGCGAGVAARDTVAHSICSASWQISLCRQMMALMPASSTSWSCEVKGLGLAGKCAPQPLASPGRSMRPHSAVRELRL